MAWKALYEYWKSKCKGTLLPSRRDIDPVTEIPQLARNLMMIEVLPSGYRYRLMGSEVASRAGYDLTSRPVGSSKAQDSIKTQWTAALDTVTRTGRPLLLVARMSPFMKARQMALVLPLLDAERRIGMILAGQFYEGPFEFPVGEGLEIVEHLMPVAQE